MKAILFFSIFIFSINNAASQTTDSVIVVGQVFNYVENENNLFVNAIVDDVIIDDQQAFPFPVNPDGSFKMVFHINSPQAFFFRFDQLFFKAFANPGDSIYLEFPMIVSADEEHELLAPDSVSFGGANKELNLLLMQFSYHIGPYRLSYSKEYHELHKGKEPFSYKPILEEAKEQEEILLEEFIKKYQVENKQFTALAHDMITYGFGNNLLRHWFDLNRRKKLEFWEGFIEELPLHLPDYGYAQDFKNYTHHFWMYKTREYQLSEPLNTLIKTRDSTYVGVLIDSLAQNYKGFALGIALTHKFATAVNRPISKANYEKYLPHFFELVEDENCKNHIRKLYGLDEGSALPIDFIKKLESFQLPGSVTEVLPVILEKHQGKIVVLDFWATWCSPCLGELKQFYPGFIKKFKDDEVAFVFLANSSPKERWQQVVSELDFEAEHHLLTNGQYSIMQALFGISGIPHHVIFDKNGEVAANKIILSDGNGEDVIRKLLGQ